MMMVWIKAQLFDDRRIFQTAQRSCQCDYITVLGQAERLSREAERLSGQ